MLSRVKIQNFKSIGEPGVDLELKPLTFLVGPNGGGKSSILDAIVFASLGGKSRVEHFNFSDINDLHFRRDTNTLSVYVEVYKPDHDLENSFTFSHTKSESLPSPNLPDAVSSSFIHKVFPIRATRGFIGDSESPIEAKWVWPDGEHTLEILEILPRAEYSSQRRLILKWASAFGLQDVAATLANRNQISGSYADDKLGTPLNASFASTGSRQVLPLILQLFWSDPDSIILIEEPEISLHPELQIRLLEMFAEAIKEEDKQIIITTHSVFMVQAIGYAVQNGWLNADQIAVYHIEKKKNIGTIAKELKVKKTGYIAGWIPSFAKVERKLLKEWASTLPKE